MSYARHEYYRAYEKLLPADPGQLQYQHEGQESSGPGWHRLQLPTSVNVDIVQLEPRDKLKVWNVKDLAVAPEEILFYGTVQGVSQVRRHSSYRRHKPRQLNADVFTTLAPGRRWSVKNATEDRVYGAFFKLTLEQAALLTPLASAEIPQTQPLPADRIAV